MDLDHPTAEELYDYVHNVQPTISKATLYRNLKIMSDEGKILKVDSPGSAARYDVTVRPHSHGKCRSCGRIFDIDMDYDYEAALKESVSDTHGFDIEGHKLIFTGLCPQCRAKGQH